ncbi:hypothetical protein PCH70_18680 [Pseudomonas cichorii JBC1]|nr:hypothetical protein PCH70_18680 [Pseudomonas cichorii JBC1]
MFWREIIEVPKLSETVSLIERWGLEIKSIEPDSNAVFFARDIFRHVDQS